MKENQFLNLKSGFKGAIWGIVTTVVLFALFSILIYSGIMSENLVKAIVIGVTAFSAFLSGYITSKSINGQGLMNGIISGTFYFLILYATNMIILSKFTFGNNLLLILLLILISSALGGVFGINIKANKRSRVRRV